MKLTVMIDLDMILDTRIAIASEIFHKEIMELVPNPRYRTRLTDSVLGELVGSTQSQWDAAWKERGTSGIIRSSVMTNMALALPKLIITSLAQPEDWDIVEEARVIINTYPYQLDKDECDTIAAMLLSNDISTYPPIFKVHCEYVPYKTQSASYLDMRKIDSLYLYDMAEWQSYRTEEWKDTKKRHHHISVVTPKLATADILKEARTPADIFESAELFYRLTGLVNVTYLEPEYVCILWDSPSS